MAFAVIDNVDNNWSTELRYLIDASLFDHGNRFTMGLQYAVTRQIDYNFENNGGQRGARIKNQINNATNVGVYFQNQFELIPTFSLVAGGRLASAGRPDRLTDSMAVLAVAPFHTKRHEGCVDVSDVENFRYGQGQNRTADTSL